MLWAGELLDTGKFGAELALVTDTLYIRLAGLDAAPDGTYQIYPSLLASC